MVETLAPPPAASVPEGDPELTPHISPRMEIGTEQFMPDIAALPDQHVAEPAVEQSSELPKDTSPVQFMGGTLHDQQMNGAVLTYIHSTGRTTLPPLSSRDTRGMPWRTRIHLDQADEVVPAPKSLLRTTDEEVKAITSLTQEVRADELIDSIEAHPDRITLIGQSADAQPALIAVHKRPDKFKNLILAFPSGISKKESRAEYLRQATSQLSKGKAKEPKPVIKPEDSYLDPLPTSASALGKLTLQRFRGSGGLRALASTMSGYQGGLLHELRQSNDAPGVSMVLGTRDPVGKPSRIIEGLQSADDVDFLLIVNSTHGIQGRKDLMDKTLELTDMMEARTQARHVAEARGEKFDTGPLEDRLIFLEEESYRVPKEEQERLRELARSIPV